MNPQKQSMTPEFISNTTLRKWKNRILRFLIRKDLVETYISD